MTSRVYAPDFSGQTSFLWLTDSLQAGELDLSDGIELPGGASIWGAPGAGEIFVVSAEELSLTRYVLGAAGFEPGERIGLGGQGISTLVGERMVFDGDERAFFFDLNSAQALELTLDDLAIVRRIDLSAARIDSAELSFLADTGFRQLGDRLVTSVYGLSASYDRVLAQSKLLSFELGAGRVEVSEMPCGGLNYSVSGPGADIYFASDPYVAAVHWLDAQSAPAPCMVRLAAADGAFAMTSVALDALTGSATGGLIQGPAGSAYLRVLDPSLYAPRAGASYLEAFSAPAWRTWQITLSDMRAAAPLERTPLAGGIRTFEVDGRAYENESTADFATTTLVETSGAALTPGLTMPGATWGIVRVR